MKRNVAAGTVKRNVAAGTGTDDLFSTSNPLDSFLYGKSTLPSIQTYASSQNGKSSGWTIILTTCIVKAVAPQVTGAVKRDVAAGTGTIPNYFHLDVFSSRLRRHTVEPRSAS